MGPLQFEKRLKNYIACLRAAGSNLPAQPLNGFKLSALNDFCLQNERIKGLLGFSEFMPYWQKMMADIKVKDLPDFKFQTTLSLNPMDLTLGYFNFYLALKDPDQQNKYLQNALAFHSFHALERLSQELIIHFDSSNQNDNFDSIHAHLSLCEKEAPWHGTPAYLLVAKLYYRYALALSRIDTKRAAAAYLRVIENVEFARLLKKKSKNDLNNAYFAQGLEKNNFLNLTTIEAIREVCIHQASNYLSPTSLSSALHSAALNLPARRLSTTLQNEQSGFLSSAYEQSGLFRLAPDRESSTAEPVLESPLFSQ